MVKTKYIEGNLGYNICFTLKRQDFKVLLDNIEYMDKVTP
jgi:hypothetical protein